MLEARTEVQSVKLSLIEEAALALTKSAAGEDTERDAMIRTWLYKLLGAGALGISGGAIAGLLRNLLREPLPSIRPQTIQPDIILPKSITQEEEEEDRLTKASQEKRWTDQWYIPDFLKGPAEEIDYAWRGGKKDEFWPLAGSVAAVAAGGIGGYKLVDWLLRKRRAAQLERKITDARAQYQQALRDLSTVSRGLEVGKAASYDFPQMLEDITDIRYDGMEKQAVWPTGAPVMQTLGVLALTLFVVSAVLARSKINQSAKHKRQLQALDSIRRYRVLSRQAPVSVVPTAIPTGLKPAEEEEEEDVL